MVPLDLSRWLKEILLKSASEIQNLDFLAPLAQLAEQVTLNHWVAGSSPARCSLREITRR